MSFARNYRSHGGTGHDDRWNSLNGYNFNHGNRNIDANRNTNYSYNWNHSNIRDYSSGKFRDHVNGYANPPSGAPAFKRRKFSADTWGDGGRHYPPYNAYEYADLSYNNSVPLPTRSNAEVSTSISCKRDCSKLEEDEPVFLSKDEIERHSPSRKDGIDALRETHLRYSYCAFLQNLGLRLELPQTTIGTGMVLCHRFFVRRSHACHDRYLIAVAALFLAAKSEETPRPLNNVVRVSCEIFHKQDITFLSYLLPVDWFEQYRERVIEAEQMILTTLNFEINVQHPYGPLTTILDKLGLSQTVLVNLAQNLVGEGLRSSLWLQFKPHHIAAGAAYLAAKFLNFDLAFYQNIWREFETTPAILQDVSQQLMELFQ
ncbi:cyclin-T1-4 isoform X1 [Populus alba]|uniref:B-like cyclin n=1 Tax=Populus alba TaxID=43335 RepID=A0A4V6A3L9_POPAL|nr:cyclin-T1-4-like isoform X1 [Populus alba]TKR83655.1 cyclin-T1-4-like [Populus alba]